MTDVLHHTSSPPDTGRISADMQTSNAPSPLEALPEDIQGDCDNEIITVINDQHEIEDNEAYDFDKIVGYYFYDGILMFKVKYTGTSSDKTWTIPFNILKRDVPLEVAKYIRDHVAEIKRRGILGTWANNLIQAHTRHLQCLHYRDTNEFWTLRRNQTHWDTTNCKSRNTRLQERGQIRHHASSKHKRGSTV